MSRRRILYAIQGTGNGHVSRALEIIPELEKYVDVDVFLSGDQSNLNLPFTIKYRSKGFVFVYDKNGRVSILKTLFKNNLLRILIEVIKIPVHKYDLVVNDFEFISAWASRMRGVNCLSICNQNSLLFPEVPKPQKLDKVGKLVLKYYAPSKLKVGFHFKSYNAQIYTPIIRKEIRELDTTRGRHYTVYLPAYSIEIIYNYLKDHYKYRFEVFSTEVEKVTKWGNMWIFPIKSNTFIKSFAGCRGIITSAGFGTTAEAIYMNKKLLVVPIKGQIEQKMNAEALRRMGVDVINDLDNKSKNILKYWLLEEKKIHVKYPDNTATIVKDKILTLIPRFNWQDINNTLLEKEVVSQLK